MLRWGVCSMCGGLAEPSHNCRLCGAMVCDRCFSSAIGVCKKCAGRIHPQRDE